MSARTPNCPTTPAVATGLDQVVAEGGRQLDGRAIALMAHPASVDARLQHAVKIVKSLVGDRLRLLFGPEHGLRGTAQYMASVADHPAEQTEQGVPVRSLYGATYASLSPRDEDIAGCDLVVFDMQDVGARYYTFGATMALAMQVAARNKVRFMVLDRPNPIGGLMREGCGIEPALTNFCGLYPLPQRHGLTMGELAVLLNRTFGIGADLQVVKMHRWQRHMHFADTQLPWVMPSPAMPTPQTALVYPGGCLLEATNLSEGRGTTRPFELCGAPWLQADAWADALGALGLPGVRFRPCAFTPTFDKHRGQMCYGVQQHVTDASTYLPLATGIAILWAARRLAPQAFAWRHDTYEFRQDVPAIDLLVGHGRLRQRIDQGADFAEVLATCQGGLAAFESGLAQALLY